MQVGDGFASETASDVGVDELARHWPRPDDGYLHRQIGEALLLRAWQSRHLRTALDLEETNGIRFRDALVHRVILRDLSVVESRTVILRHQITAV